MGTPNREPQEYSRNMIGIYLSVALMLLCTKFGAWLFRCEILVGLACRLRSSVLSRLRGSRSHFRQRQRRNFSQNKAREVRVEGFRIRSESSPLRCF